MPRGGVEAAPNKRSYIRLNAIRSLLLGIPRATLCQQFCRTLGRTLEEIKGKTDFDFFPHELAAKYQRDDRLVIETGKPYETVEENQPPGGQKMYVQVVKTPLYGADGKIIGLQGIFWDITQQRMADEKIRRVNALLAQNRKDKKPADGR